METSLSSRKLQLRIYGLFMLVDGECSLNEQRKFDAICEQMGIDKETKNEVLSYCDTVFHISMNRLEDISKTVLEELKKMLTEPSRARYPFEMTNYYELLTGKSRINASKGMQAQTVWTLINLGYADAEYSESEKKIVSFLVDFWKTDGALVADMSDTAETMAALTRQKEWIKTTSRPYDVINRAIQEIDKDMQLMIDNTETLIYEADIT